MAFGKRKNKTNPSRTLCGSNDTYRSARNNLHLQISPVAQVGRSAGGIGQVKGCVFGDSRSIQFRQVGPAGPQVGGDRWQVNFRDCAGPQFFQSILTDIRPLGNSHVGEDIFSIIGSDNTRVRSYKNRDVIHIGCIS